MPTKYVDGGPGRPFTEAVSIQVACPSQAELDHGWERLPEGGGRETRCGRLTDRYGSGALSRMVETDIAELEWAADAA